MALATVGTKLARRTRKYYRLARMNVAPYRPASPESLGFNVTSRCNMRCRHCYSPTYGREDLSLDEISVVVQDIAPLRGLGLSGGEPFLRADLAEICGLFAARSPRIRISVTSNGYDPSGISEGVQRILDTCPQATLGMYLSLEGFAATHDSVRAASGAFERTMATARAVNKIRGDTERLRLGFVATLHDQNWGELPSLARFVRDEFDVDLDFHLLLMDVQQRDVSLHLPPAEALPGAVDAINAATSVPIPAETQVYRDLRLRTIAERRQVVPCRAGSSGAVLQASGEVQSCFMLPPLGNVREQPFTTIWRSGAALREYESIRRRECWCNADCNVASSMPHYWKFPVLVRRERMRQKARNVQQSS